MAARQAARSLAMQLRGAAGANMARAAEWNGAAPAARGVLAAAERQGAFAARTLRSPAFMRWVFVRAPGPYGP